jgi:ABC-type Co2+ transport system permease subunit
LGGPQQHAGGNHGIGDPGGNDRVMAILDRLAIWATRSALTGTSPARVASLVATVAAAALVLALDAAGGAVAAVVSATTGDGAASEAAVLTWTAPTGRDGPISMLDMVELLGGYAGKNGTGP